MSFLKAILLGILQGLTEFLPVSSSGHIMLFSEILNMDLEGGVLSAFTVTLHAGTLMAVGLWYIKPLLYMLAHPIKSDLKWLVVATLPTVIYALILKWTGLETTLDACARGMLPYAFLLTAVFLLLCDGIAKNRRIARNTHSSVRFTDALRMGLMQCIGTFSGVSRSGSTLTGGIASGLERRKAADFCFLMSVPASCGAIVLECGEAFENPASVELLKQNLLPVIAGVLAAFLVGMAAIALMLKLVKKTKLKWFSLYLLLLAVLVIVNDFVGIWA